MAEQDTNKPPRAFVRFGIIVMFVPMLIVTALFRLARELSSAPKYVWWSCCDYVEGCAHMWRTGDLPTEDEW